MKSLLNRATNRKLEQYASCTGLTASAVANEAISYWMDTIGDVIIEAATEKKVSNGCNVIAFPASCQTEKISHRSGARKNNVIAFRRT